MLLNRLISGLGPRKGPAAPDPETAARVLLGDDGVLSREQLPAALVRFDGTVISASRTFEGLFSGDALRGVLGDLIREAVSAGTMRREIIDLAGCEGAAAVWDFVVLPLAGGQNALVQAHDVTRDHALHEALVDSRRRYKDLVEASSDFVWETGPGGSFVFVSPDGALGYAAEELIDRHPADFVPASLASGGSLPFLAREAVSNVDVWFRRPDGSAALLVVSAMPIVGEKGGWMGARGVCRDITEERERDAALAAAQTRERLLAYVVRAIHDEISPADMLDAAATAVAKTLSGAGCRIYRVSPDGAFVEAASHGAPAPQCPLERSLLIRAASSGRPVMSADSSRHLMCAATSYRRQVNGAISLTRTIESGAFSHDDVTLVSDIALQLAIAMEQIAYHGKLEKLSRTDELTGLLNRRAFFEELESRIGRDRPMSGAGALFFVDLDNFKLVNDVHGHHRGDEALVEVATILTENTRPGDLVSRFGGDEFALWLDRTDDSSAVPRARELLAAAERLRAFSGDPTRPLSLSVGIATWTPGCGETVAGLTGRADAAMYEIKHGSKSGYVLAPGPDAASQSSDLST